MIVAGIGFREAARADEIVALVEEALRQAALPYEALGALATAASLAGAPAFLAAAGRLAVRGLGIDASTLAAADARGRTRSARSLSAHGVGSVAEAAALGAAGPRAILRLSRIASSAVACALAGDPP